MMRPFAPISEIHPNTTRINVISIVDIRVPCFEGKRRLICMKAVEVDVGMPFFDPMISLSILDGPPFDVELEMYFFEA